MGEPWAARGAEGAPTQLPLVLTALWAVAVVLELAYVMVLGPGPPPLGPLARALQLALAAYQLLNLLGNVGLFLRSDPSIRGVMLAGRGLGQGWAYCYQCQSQVPPRSGHCSACRVCILRRDHHCRLLGRCVGFHNYRPFLCLLLHTAGVLLHVSVLLSPALSALLRAHSAVYTVALLLLPWLMLLTGVQLLSPASCLSLLPPGSALHALLQRPENPALILLLEDPSGSGASSAAILICFAFDLQLRLQYFHLFPPFWSSFHLVSTDFVPSRLPPHTLASLAALGAPSSRQVSTAHTSAGQQDFFINSQIIDSV
ncbi:probable palmitoyltransferase ZDHHC24 isoform X1 [Microtus oregoni]|uniref:probable palmitoyltransferase ZDHHC24 isoform X1 n=1 Tax=Microtus oregoni TaxID=111838 RepID=UPI001BB0DCC3|nr:probable palmitoyltransferase ZDHHC24 isoform X1 [Microtus oregoni]